MDRARFHIISEALYAYGASDLNTDILKSVSLEELISVITSPIDPRASFRAAWATEHILIQSPQLLYKHRTEIIEAYLRSTNWSVLRSISKLVMQLTKPLQRDPSFLSEDNVERVLERTLNILSHRDCPIAVRCNAYDITFALTAKYTWLAQELRTQIQFDLEKNSTPALSSRGLRILKKLKE